MKKLFLAACLLVGMLIPQTAGAVELPHKEQPDYLNSVKITFLSWLSGSTKISYERAFPSSHQSGEICASLISAGYDKYQNSPMGFTVRYGHKFFLGEQDLSLKGFYLRPEFIYSYYHQHSVNGALYKYCTYSEEYF